MTIFNLRQYRLVYLATVYRKNPSGLQVAYEEACRLAARLCINGINIYCPISHGHGLSVLGGINPVDNSFWSARNKPFMDVCDALLVAKMENWRQSVGIKDEEDEFIKAGKPIYYIEPNSLQIRSFA